MGDKVIKIFNLTDVATPQLSQHKLVDQHIVVGKTLLSPGACVEVGEDPSMMAGLRHFVMMGALAVDSLPPSYAVAKAKKDSAAKIAKKNDPNPGDVFKKSKRD